MKIKIFESGSGVRFLITTANPTEQKKTLVDDEKPKGSTEAA